MNNMFLVTCFISFFINIILPFCQATHPLCNKWNTILETALTPTLNTTSSLGISAEGAARRVIGFVRENSTVLDVGGHLGIFSEAIISMYNEKFSNTFLSDITVDFPVSRLLTSSCSELFLSFFT